MRNFTSLHTGGKSSEVGRRRSTQRLKLKFRKFKHSRVRAEGVHVKKTALLGKDLELERTKNRRASTRIVTKMNEMPFFAYPLQFFQQFSTLVHLQILNNDDCTPFDVLLWLFILES